MSKATREKISEPTGEDSAVIFIIMKTAS